MTVVKIQIPWEVKDAEALIYNKDRSFYSSFPAESFRPVMGGRLKAFFEAMILNNHLTLINEVPDQDW